MQHWLEEKHICGVGIGYIENGAVKELAVYGKDDTGSQYPANILFNVASLTKPVTAMVALKLVNKGMWDLDEPVYKYWTDPDIADDPRSKLLTTRHILSHTTGFPNWRWKLKDKRLAFEFDPGTKYQYSGEGFEYLREAMEHKFGKTLPQLAQELIFTPLQMNETYFFWDKGLTENRVAAGCDKDAKPYTIYKNTAANAADDLLTSVSDYCKFLQHVMNGAGLDKKLYEEMISLQAHTQKNHQHFGLGWVIYEGVDGGDDVISHGGDDKGAHTIVFILPQSKNALAIFTNSDNGTELYIPAVQHYLGEAGQKIIDIETN